VFRNAGGLITDDAIRSAMLTCQFFGTEEIVIINHTECGMMSAHADTLVAALKDKGIDVDNVPVDPSLPELKLESGAFAKWLRMFDDVDEICARQVEYVRNHPLIPKHVTVSGWI
jgi:carbonic anhydrase